MRRIIGGLPPRYPGLLRLTLAAALARAAALVPFFLVYFLPLGPWFRPVLLLCPVLWVAVVCPARVRYAGLLAAFAADGAMPLRARDLFVKDKAWRSVCIGRVKLMRRWALPLCVLLAFLFLLFLFADAFSAVKILLDVFGGAATIAAAVAAFLPRLWMGEPVVQQADALGAMAALAAVLAVSLYLFGWGAFRSGAYRFGMTAGMPKATGMKPLLKSNLLLWLPTLAILAALLILAHKELGLLFANLLAAGPAFTVKLQIPQIILPALAAVSYFLLLPLRKLNTARWAADQL